MKRTKIFTLIAELLVVIGIFTGCGEVKNPSMSTIVKNVKENEIIVDDKTFAEEIAPAEIEEVEPTSVDIEETKVEEAEPTFVESAPVEIEGIETEEVMIEETEIEEADVEEVQPAQTVPTSMPVVTEPVQTVEPTPAQIEVAEPMQTTPVISEPEPTPMPVPVHMHDWKEHVVTTQTWIPNIVVMDDYETKIVESYLFICYCDFETNDADVIQQHVEDHIDANEIELAGFGIQDHSYREQIKVGSHEEDHGYYETSTYVDYYYCDCGATR